MPSGCVIATGIVCVALILFSIIEFAISTPVIVNPSPPGSDAGGVVISILLNLLEMVATISGLLMLMCQVANGTMTSSADEFFDQAKNAGVGSGVYHLRLCVLILVPCALTLAVGIYGGYCEIKILAAYPEKIEEIIGVLQLPGYYLVLVLFVIGDLARPLGACYITIILAVNSAMMSYWTKWATSTPKRTASELQTSIQTIAPMLNPIEQAWRGCKSHLQRFTGDIKGTFAKAAAELPEYLFKKFFIHCFGPK
eukprot:TRINITY_DN5979_c0_g1_i1.p1 TRINITY_DN5979_c0_g1~~TRINITY_DN5979_c0_g1_i1.p1  ORF type:complete len:254 (+),score=31.98 TRINITY_DN5979_c0_g1_i1:78-839(+)